MRVRSNTPARLVIEDRPWALGVMLGLVTLGLAAGAFAALGDGRPWIALVCALLAAGAVALSSHAVERVWLVLDRPSGTLELRRRSVRGFSVARYPLSDLRGIELQRDTSGDGGPTYRLALRLAGQPAPLPMTRHLGGGGAASACVEAARDWLGAPPLA